MTCCTDYGSRPQRRHARAAGAARPGGKDSDARRLDLAGAVLLITVQQFANANAIGFAAAQLVLGICAALYFLTPLFVGLLPRCSQQA